MNSESLHSRIRNYHGSNSFLIQMKNVLDRYHQLTPKQSEAAEKCLNQGSVISVDGLPDNLKVIAEYSGENKFVLDIKEKILKWGTITNKQKDAALHAIQTDIDRKNTIHVKIPTPGETIKIRRKIGQSLKEKYELKFNPILIDITKILAVSRKAIQFSGKLTIKRGKVCTICMKTLTDEFSMLSGVGKTCSENFGIEYLKSKEDTQRFREEYLKRIEEIGEMEFWVPKTQIVIWEGESNVVPEMLGLWN